MLPSNSSSSLCVFCSAGERAGGGLPGGSGGRAGVCGGVSRRGDIDSGMDGKGGEREGEERESPREVSCGQHEIRSREGMVSG